MSGVWLIGFYLLWGFLSSGEGEREGESKVKKTLLLCVECEEKKMGVFFLFFLFFYGEREFESLDREREKQDKKTGKHK